MPSKFRLFAGPNGSGKTSLFESLKRRGIIHTELYINADRIERELKDSLNFNFNAYRIKVSQQDFLNHIKKSTLFLEKIKDENFITQVSIQAGVLQIQLPSGEVNSYHASFIASYLVEKLFETNQSFCFETVMSHQSKIAILEIAKLKGYKTYLYFVYTDNPELNVARVKLRALMGLHDVNPETVRSRYKRSFDLLPQALAISDEAYIINNSDNFNIVATKRNNIVTIIEPASSIEGLIKP